MLHFGGSGQLGLLHLFEYVADLQGTVENTDHSQTSKKKNLRLWLRGFAFGKFCQVTQADAILGIFLLRFSKPSVSNILVLSNIA